MTTISTSDHRQYVRVAARLPVGPPRTRMQALCPRLLQAINP
jgi:hypothetical protein